MAAGGAATTGAEQEERPTVTLIRWFSSPTASRTAFSDGMAGTAWASLAASLRSLSGGGRSTSASTPSRRRYSRSHACPSSDSPRFGSGWPAPGRLSKAPRAAASLICLSIHEVKVISDGLRSVMCSGYRAAILTTL